MRSVDSHYEYMQVLSKYNISRIEEITQNQVIGIYLRKIRHYTKMATKELFSTSILQTNKSGLN